MMHTGVIYGYPHYVGQVQSDDPRRWERRWKTHAKMHLGWSRPVVLETITGADRADLLFNLAFQETVWMFKQHTYKPIWSDGFNKCFPFSTDYTNLGRIGARATHAIMAANPEKYREARVRGGRNVPREARIRGSLAAMAANPEKYHEARVRGGRIGARITNAIMAANPEKYHETLARGATIANHRRWHLARGVENPRCGLCVMATSAREVILAG